MYGADPISRATGATLVTALNWRDALNAAMDQFQINTPARAAAFLAQVGHESCGLSKLVESLNYAPEALLATFNSATVTRFTKVDAYRFGRTAAHPADQVEIANIAYGGRMGNGPHETGDGWRYRGRGPLGTTGKANYGGARDALRKLLGSDVPDFVVDPEYLCMPKWGALCAGLYWRDRGCNTLADIGDFDGISDMINIGHKTNAVGDSNGYADRLRLYKAAKQALGITS